MFPKKLFFILWLIFFASTALAQEAPAENVEPQAYDTNEANAQEATPENGQANAQDGQPPPLTEAQKKQLERQKKLQETYDQFLKKQEENRNTPPSPPISNKLIGRKPLPKVTESDAYLERLFQNKLILEGLVKPQAKDDISYELFMKGVK